MIIGITGGSGCGKTTLLNVIRQAGGLVLDCDAIYHHLLQHNTAMLRAIDARFPGTVKEGMLDRKALGAIVFSDESALQDLNRITHSAVKQEVLRRLKPNASDLLQYGPSNQFPEAQLCHATRTWEVIDDVISC